MTPAPSAPLAPPSPWVRRFAPLAPPGAPVLDVACGSGRHMRWFAQLGHCVTGVDRDPHALATARAWVRRFAPLAPPGAPVLDVACGSGRHMRWFAQLGHRVTGVDRDPHALAAARAWGAVIEADIENGPWPLPGRRFGAVVVTNYLWRPLLPVLLETVALGGVLIYETFAAGNETVGKPSRADFLLQPGELLRACEGLRVVAYEDGFLSAPERFVQRIVAVRPAAPPHAAPPRYALAPP